MQACGCKCGHARAQRPLQVHINTRAQQGGFLRAQSSLRHPSCALKRVRAPPSACAESVCVCVRGCAVAWLCGRVAVRSRGCA
eukprot:3034862-Pleurochrysis_carterae.AAC.1